MDNEMLKEDKGYLQKINLSKKDIWLDAGSHIGGFSMFIYNKVKKVIAVEPSKDNYKLLVNNIKNNKIKNVKTIHKAIVENKDKSREFYLNRYENKGLHSLLIKKGRDVEIVKCININELIEKYQINKIKMDIEGMEYEILKVITSRNYKKIKELVVEFHLKTLKDHKGKKYKEIIKLLKRHFKTVQYNSNLSWTQIIYCKK